MAAALSMFALFAPSVKNWNNRFAAQSRVDAFWEVLNWLKHHLGTLLILDILLYCKFALCNMEMRYPMVLVVLLSVCLSNSCAAKAGKPALKAVSFSKAAVDLNKDCANNYPKLNYKPVTTVCSTKVPATKACCAAFNKFACQFRSQVNNFNTVCPIMFMSYLNYAGGYQDGYFIGTCIDGKKGLCV